MKETTLRFIGDWNLWWGAALALALAVGAWLYYRRECRDRVDFRKWLLPTLRALAIGLLVLVLTGPVLHHREKIGQLARVLMFVDASKSMGVTDAAMPPGRKLLTAARMGWLPESLLPQDLLGAEQAVAKARRESANALAQAAEDTGDAEKLQAAATAFLSDLDGAYGHLKKVRDDGELMKKRRPDPPKGQLLYERWNGVNGNRVEELTQSPKFRAKPDATQDLREFRSPKNVGDNYGARLSGWLYPPATGAYTFYMYSDDGGELWLSDSERPDGKQRIAHVESFAADGQWESSPAQKSKSIELMAGKRYYIEALFKEGNGDDFIAVGWRLPDGNMERPIPGNRLSKVTEQLGAPAFGSAQAARDEFARELLEPARALAGRKKPDAGELAAELLALSQKAGEWRDRLRLSFDRAAEKLAATEREEVREALKRFDELTRWQRVQQLLLEGDDPLLPRLAKNHNVELLAFGATETLPLWRGRAARADDEEEPPTVLASEPAAEASNIGLGLADALAVGTAGRNGAPKAEDEATDDEAAAPLDEQIAVVIFSDGRHNNGESPTHLAKICGSRHIPVFAVAVGSERPPEDMAVVRMEAPDSVFHKDRVKGRIVLRDNMPAGKLFKLQVVSDGKTLWEKELKTEGTQARHVDYDFPVEEFLKERQEQASQKLIHRSIPLHLTVKFTGLEELDKEPGNNERVHRMRGIFQHNKILLLEGRPRWEFRYLRNLFDRDEKWETTSILADPLKPDGGIKRGDEAGMFPADRESLYAYDLIVLSDFPRELFRGAELEWLRDFVGNRGGGLLLIDGERRYLRGYADTPLEPLIPVEWGEDALGERPSALRLTEKGQLRLTKQGVGFSALTLASETAENALIWESLKPPHWLAPVNPLPGAEVLLEAVVEEQSAPALVSRRFGGGKVLYSAFHETWRFRFRVADKHHARYWNQLGNWIVAQPFAVTDKTISLDAGALVYAPGDSAGIRARVVDKNGKPEVNALVNAELYLDGKKMATVPLEADKERGEYRGLTGGLGEGGEYEVRLAVAGYPEEELRARTQFYVQAPERGELSELSCDEELLRQLATNSSGKYFREEDARDLAEQLEPLSKGRIVESDTALWQSYWWFVPIVLLLTVEWFLRKRGGML